MKAATKLLYKYLLIASIFSGLVACSSVSRAETVSADIEAVEASGIRNLMRADESTFSSGQPTKEELKALSEAGVENIVSLRTEGEIDWDEKAYVESLGMTYHSLPVSGETGINMENAAELRGILDSVGDEATVLHCGSGNRVGALMALDALNSNGGDIDSAVEVGKEWGLTRLESTVRAQAEE